ncbi:hypothetical protein NS53R_14165, partial [Mammaliicoccus sciuri]
DGTYLGFYVHYDGYLEGVGHTLKHYYSSREKVKELIDKKVPLSALGCWNGENGVHFLYILFN